MIRDQRGAGTLLMAAVLLLALVITAVAAVVGVVAVAQHDVANAADLAALSGSAAKLRGQDACVVAKQIAVQNGAELITCKVSGDEIDFVVTVKVEHQLELPLGSATKVHANAQAGRLGPVG